MSSDLNAAIAALERSLSETERKANALRSAINTLCEEAGKPPKYPDIGETGEHLSVSTQIQSDTFYGKKQSTAIRMYLEIRKSQGVGPATPREVFEALRTGGYQFETKNEITALIGLRALLRKNTVTFHKLPNGTYGLATWYPDAKAGRPSDDDDENEEAAPTRRSGAASELRKARVPGKRGRPRKTPERKEVPDAANRPDVRSPVKDTEAA
jgi:hypothetical protein